MNSRIVRRIYFAIILFISVFVLYESIRYSTWYYNGNFSWWFWVYFLFGLSSFLLLKREVESPIYKKALGVVYTGTTAIFLTHFFGILDRLFQFEFLTPGDLGLAIQIIFIQVLFFAVYLVGIVMLLVSFLREKKEK